MKDLVLTDAADKLPALREGLKKAGMDDFFVLPTGGPLARIPSAARPVGISSDLVELYLDRRDYVLCDRIKRTARTARRVFIATDADQTGDALAADITKLLGDHPGVTRVRLRSLDLDGIVHGFTNAEPLSERDAWPTTLRRILDRLISSTYSSVSTTEELRVERVRSALIGILGAEPLPSAMAHLALPAIDRHGPFTATFPVFADGLDQAHELVERCRTLPPICAGTSVSAPGYVPWNYGETLLAICEASDRAITIDEAALSLERLYEAGRLSFPRSDANAVTAEAISRLGAIAEAHGVRFEGSRLPQFSRQKRHAHESPRPTASLVDIGAPLGILPPDDAALSLITRHLIACGQPHVLQAPDGAQLPTWAQGIPWSRRLSRWLRPWPRRAPRCELRPTDMVAAVLKILLERALSDPRGCVREAASFGNGQYLDLTMRLTAHAKRLAALTPPALLDPLVCRELERFICEAAEQGRYGEPPARLARTLLEQLGLWGDVSRVIDHDSGALPTSRSDTRTFEVSHYDLDLERASFLHPEHDSAEDPAGEFEPTS
jgi:DNA topoisomerase I